ncbi:hypothetical protein HMPREF9431_02464 [Segatella oulorum F0390]|uniref:Uncharacterized protein n=1 Tax=Segatella oulorum F0390 TaxID=702438 RepID=G1WF63_9BACT|nr:hypothetical protein HMPREF9431_02464 [Segatella oulorum F0390]
MLSEYFSKRQKINLRLANDLANFKKIIWDLLTT